MLPPMPAAPPRARVRPAALLAELLTALLAALPAALLFAPLLTACESTALSLRDPSEQTITFEPQYISGIGEEITVTLRFDGLEAAAPCADERACVLLDYEVGDGLGVGGVVFVTNFELRFNLTLFRGATEGLRSLTFIIRNDYGTFAVSGDFYVF